MLLSLLVVVLIGIVAYFHYLQGLFSAGLSAALAAISAILAVGFHEALIALINGGRFSDYVTAASLVCIFSLSYLLLRFVFDKAIPGNVRFPLLVDRIGAAVLGVVAGLFPTGILLIAVQSLPFGPSIAMYERFPMQWGKTVDLKIGTRYGLTTATYDLLDEEKFCKYPEDAAGLLIPCDQILLHLVDMVSRPNGSLECGRSFSSIHPDYLQELFGQRVGIQSGSKHTAMAGELEVVGLYTAAQFPQDDPERWLKEGNSVGIRGPKSQPPPPPLPPVYRPGPNRMLLVIRARLDRGGTSADDQTSMIAFTPASVRLVANGRNYFPIGTLETGRVLFRNAVDDPLFVPAGKGVDLVYEVAEADLLASVKDRASSPQVAPGTFLEFKRFAREWLSGRSIPSGVPMPGALVEVVRKEGAPAGTDVQAQQLKASLLITDTVEISNRLSSGVNVGSDAENLKGEQDWGSFVVMQGKFSRVEVQPVRTVQAMAQGRAPIDELFVPADLQMLQVGARPAPHLDDKWAWASDISEYKLVGSDGKAYSCFGACALVKNAAGQDFMVLRYDAEKPATSVPADKSMRPTDVRLLFLVPKGAEIKSLDYKGQIYRTMQLRVQ